MASSPPTAARGRKLGELVSINRRWQEIVLALGSPRPSHPTKPTLVPSHVPEGAEAERTGGRAVRIRSQTGEPGTLAAESHSADRRKSLTLAAAARLDKLDKCVMGGGVVWERAIVPVSAAGMPPSVASRLEGYGLISAAGFSTDCNGLQTDCSQPGQPIPPWATRRRGELGERSGLPCRLLKRVPSVPVVPSPPFNKQADGAGAARSHASTRGH